MPQLIGPPVLCSPVIFSSVIHYFTFFHSWMDPDTPFGKLASRVFFGDDDNFRDQRLKLIPKARGFPPDM